MSSPSPDRMPRDLAVAAQSGLDWLRDILGQPVDCSNSALLRAQSAAAGIAINAQLRADSLRMRSAREDKALDRLVRIMQEKALTVPSSVSELQHPHMALSDSPLLVHGQPAV